MMCSLLSVSWDVLAEVGLWVFSFPISMSAVPEDRRKVETSTFESSCLPSLMFGSLLAPAHNSEASRRK